MNAISDIIQFMKLMGFENKTGLDSSELEKELVDQFFMFRTHGPRNAGEKWCIRNRQKYGFKYEKHRPEATCECQRSPHIRKTVYNHQCTGCKCKNCLPRKNRYLGFPELQANINAIGTVLTGQIINYRKIIRQEFELLYCKERFTGVTPQKSYNRVIFALIERYRYEIDLFVNKDLYRRRVIIPFITNEINRYNHSRGAQGIIELNATRISWKMVDLVNSLSLEPTLVQMENLLQDVFHRFGVLDEIAEELSLPLAREPDWNEFVLMEQEDLREIEHSRKRVTEAFKEPPSCLFCLGTIDHYLIACNNCKDSEGNHKMCSHYACMDQWFQHSGNVRCGYCRNEDYSHY